MMNEPARVTDERLERLTESRQSLIRSLALECKEARDRGTMPTIDLTSHLSTNRLPENCEDSTFVRVRDGGLSICAWTPEKDGKGKTTQVLLVFDLGHIVPGFKAVSKMKSGPGVDMLIRLLAQYRAEVWPDYRGVKVKD